MVSHVKEIDRLRFVRIIERGFRSCNDEVHGSGGRGFGHSVRITP